MASAASVIAALDRALVKNGQDITLRRVYGQAPNVIYSDVTVRGRARTPTAQEIAAGMTQADSVVIMSMTQILDRQWPGGQVADSNNSEPALPRRLDRMIIDGRDRQVDRVNPFRFNQTVVRLEVRVLG